MSTHRFSQGTPAWRSSLLAAASALAFLLFTFPAHAAPPPLLISEIQSSGISPLEDALEIFNPTRDNIEITGWKVQIYGEFNTLTDTLVIPPFTLRGETGVVLGDGNGQNSTTHLYFPNSSIFWQANEAGACVLIDSRGDPVDFVRWDGSTVSPPAGTSFGGNIPSSAMNPGTTLSRDSRFTDRDRSDDWCLRPATLGARNEDECLSDVIRITEITANGPPGDDKIELHNAGRSAHNIGNLRLPIYGEANNLTDTLKLPSFVLQPGAYVVINDRAGTDDAGNLYFDGAMVFWQENEAGACALLDGSVHGIDFVRWDGSGVPPPGGTSFSGTPPSSSMNAGTSLSRDSQLRDTNDASDWCLRPATLGSPNADECMSDVIRITEITANGPPGDDRIELYNAGTVAHNIGNLQLLIYGEVDNLTDTLKLPSFVLQPGAYVVINDRAGTNDAGNLYFDGAAIFWQENEAGACALLDGSVHGIDFVRWDGSAAPVPPGTAFTGAIRSSAMNRGTSLSRDSGHTDTNRGRDWCLRPATLGSNNADECLSDVIRINEITASGPPGDDKIELYNSGSVAHNVQHLQLLIYGENDNLTDTIVLPDLVIQPGSYLVIYDSAGTNDSANLYLETAAIFWQPNEPGACALLDGSVHGIDFVRWDASAVAPPPGTGWNGSNPSSAMTATMSLGRRMDGVDNNSGNDWIIDTATFGAPNPVFSMNVLEANLRDEFVRFQFDGMEIGSRVTIETSGRLEGGWQTLDQFVVQGRRTTRTVQTRDPDKEAWFRATMR